MDFYGQAFEMAEEQSRSLVPALPREESGVYPSNVLVDRCIRHSRPGRACGADVHCCARTQYFGVRAASEIVKMTAVISMLFLIQQKPISIEDNF